MPLDQTQDAAQRGAIAQAVESAWQRLRQALGAAQQSTPRAAEVTPDIFPRNGADTVQQYREEVGQLNRSGEEVTSVTEREEKPSPAERERFDLSPEEQADLDQWLDDYDAAQRAIDQELEDAEWGDSFDDQVTFLKTSEWHIYAPGEEYRTHLGRSDEGYHYAVETSHQGGDDYENGLPWSRGYQTQAEAESAMSEVTWRLHQAEQEHEQDDEEHEL